MTTTKAHCPETRLRNAFAKYMEEHGSDKAIAVVQKVLAKKAAPFKNNASPLSERP